MDILTVRHKDTGGQNVDTMVPTYDIYSASLAGFTTQIAALEARLASVETLATQTAVSLALHSQHG